MIPYGKHFLDQDDIDAVVDVLKNGALTQGPKVAEFERSIAKYTGAKFAVAVSSGTAALHLSCLVSGVNFGDKVVTSANTFVASANCALYVGAEPQVVDIDQATLNIDLNLLEKACEQHSSIGAIIPVHFAGSPCDMEYIRRIANKNKAFLIEDASHALGARYDNGHKVGNCEFSDLTVFSFHPVKGIASGEGGMITTNNSYLYKKLLLLRSHGICKGNFDLPGIGDNSDDELVNKKEGIENNELKLWYYEMQMLGYNYRITDIQAALAISQMKKIDMFLERRRDIVSRYDKAFKFCQNIQPTQIRSRDFSSHHLYVIRVKFKNIRLTRNQFMLKLREKGIGTQVHYIPIPMQPYYEAMGLSIGDYPVSKAIYEELLSIPIYYELTDEMQDFVISAILTLAE